MKYRRRIVFEDVEGPNSPQVPEEAAEFLRQYEIVAVKALDLSELIGNGMYNAILFCQAEGGLQSGDMEGPGLIIGEEDFCGDTEWVCREVRWSFEVVF